MRRAPSRRRSTRRRRSSATPDNQYRSGPHLCARPQSDVRPGRGGADRARRRARVAAVRLRHGGRHRGVPGAGARRPRAGAEGDVLVAAQLADEFRHALGTARRVHRHDGPGRGAPRDPAWQDPKLVWIETPANPLWSITDIAATCEIAHAAGAAVAVDSTVGTPVLTRPLELGADIVMHAATKYLNGHSDVIAGTLTTREDSALWQRIKCDSRATRRRARAVRGVAAARAACARCSRACARACASAQRIAEHFAQHPRIAEVLYPGLPVVRRTCDRRRSRCTAASAACCRSAFAVRDGGRHRARPRPSPPRRTSQLWKRATSLGGVESLVEHRASVEGAGTPVPADLLRLSVGIEDAGDLIADLEDALSQRTMITSHCERAGSVER